MVFSFKISKNFLPQQKKHFMLSFLIHPTYKCNIFQQRSYLWQIKYSCFNFILLTAGILFLKNLKQCPSLLRALTNCFMIPSPIWRDDGFSGTTNSSFSNFFFTNGKTLSSRPCLLFPVPKLSTTILQTQETKTFKVATLFTLFTLHQSTAASTWWCGPRPRLGWVEMAVGLPEGPSYPGHSPFIFSLCCPLNDRRRAAHSIFKIGRLFLLFLLSCPTLALLRLLILLLLLMSGNVHPNPGPIFPCSVCAGNVTWRGKSVQCCACSKWVHLRCSQLSLSNFRALGSSHSWSCPPMP